MTPQQEFDRRYISTVGIQSEIGVSRSSITYAIKIGTLPAPIRVNGGGALIWERSAISLELTAWKKRIGSRYR